MEEFVCDGSVDFKGRSNVRAKTGGWRACSLIIGYELVERLAFAGVWANLVVYLTTKLHEGTVSSSNNVNNWVGTLSLTPLLGAYIADTYLGRFRTFLASSCIYILGMGIMTLAVSLKSLKPPECPSNEGCKKASSLQVGIFYFALYLLALGQGGTRPNISTFGADQFDDLHPKEKIYKNSFFNWWVFIVFFGSLFGQTFIVYIQDNISWGVSYGIITGLIIIAYVVFIIGSPIYRYKAVAGSPLKRVAKVIVRMIQNRKMQVPTDATCLHEVDSKEYISQGRYPIGHTKTLRIFDKAAILNSRHSKPCSVTDVEETKLVMRVLTIWLTVIFPSTILGQAATLFIKQAMTMDRHMGSKFQIPSGSIGVFLQIPMLLTIVIYDRFIIPFSRKFTGNPRGITILQRIGVGIVLQAIAMVVAAVAEVIRLNVIKSHGIAHDMNAIVPLTFATLIPQLAVMGIAEAMVEVGKLEFFYDQAPDSMRSLGNAMYAASQGLGSFLSSGILTVVTNITGRNGHKSWILDNLNASRLDYFYALLAVLSIMNCLLFLTMSCLYTYKREPSEALGNDSSKLTQAVDHINTKDEGSQL
ncbi:protein NRT1/ PTR FAMILY 5.3-like [Cryptomeria japonica]|uniref:protein NRT1/ PTR FAMILY 5.3-like n=1 Tax=Cryptomeria japonica TaxID=3369 RepID=UPI0027D9F4D8|nr:protein NRT1/ PTR FAMILY 5.3-like [Cryptomeria japonica]